MLKRGRQNIPDKSAEIEKKAQRAKDSKLFKAVRAWRRASRQIQHQLVREIVETRADELRKAYPAIRGIASGFRTKTIGKERVITREPSVVLMVGSKWKGKPKSTAARAKELPKYLWAYIMDPKSGERCLCAVPVDVESGLDYRIKPQGSSHVLMVKNPLPRQRGVVTCTVKMPIGFGGDHAVSCHHVFAMSKVTAPKGSAASRARLHVRLSNRQPGIEVGQLSVFRGRLVHPSKGLSFDAALARITDATGYQSVAPSPAPTSAIISENDLPFKFCIMTPGGTIRARYVQTWRDFNQIMYIDGPRQPVQPIVVECQVEDDLITKSGDSGSPVLNAAMNKLIGMHIAGKDQRAFFLPAYDLLNGKNYGLNAPLRLVIE